MRNFHTPALLSPIIAGIVIAIVSPQMARADDLDPEAIKVVLHTTNDIEGGFIERTVAMVRAGSLPRDLFTSCFIWARKKPRHRFEYFQQALTTRAAAIGINL